MIFFIIRRDNPMHHGYQQGEKKRRKFVVEKKVAISKIKKKKCAPTAIRTPVDSLEGSHPNH